MEYTTIKILEMKKVHIPDVVELPKVRPILISDVGIHECERVSLRWEQKKLLMSGFIRMSL